VPLLCNPVQHTLTLGRPGFQRWPLQLANMKYATRLLGGPQRGQVLRQLAGLGAGVLLDAVVLLARRVIQLQLPLRRLITQLLLQGLLCCRKSTLLITITIRLKA